MVPPNSWFVNSAQLARCFACCEHQPAAHDPLSLSCPAAAGMIQQKGLGKKKRREKARQLDRGLNEDRGAFKPGVLRVKPPIAAVGKRR